LKIKDVDLKEGRLYIKAKNKAVKIKILPDILKKEMPDLLGMDPNSFLFTPDGFGLNWDAKTTKEIFSQNDLILL
jgi:hypothetical protein